MNLKTFFGTKPLSDVRPFGVAIYLFAIGGLVAAPSCTSSPLLSRSTPSMTPEVIVKFAAASPLGKAITDQPGRPVGENPAIQSGVKSLSRSLSIPLTAKNITSGSELVLEIDARSMRSMLRERLEKYPSVSTVRDIDVDQKPIVPQIGEELAVGFLPKARESKTLDEASACKNPTECLAPVVAKLAKITGYALKGRLIRGRRLAVGIDLDATVKDLVARLKGHRDVEYAQPNFVMRPMMPLAE